MRYAPEYNCCSVEPTPAGDLRQKRLRPHDRPRDQMRKKRHEHGELNQVFGRLDLAAINVDDVTHRLKRVKRDADRQNELEVRKGNRQSNRAERGLSTFHKEIIIFKIAKQSQVEHHR